MAFFLFVLASRILCMAQVLAGIQAAGGARSGVLHDAKVDQLKLESQAALDMVVQRKMMPPVATEEEAEGEEPAIKEETEGHFERIQKKAKPSRSDEPERFRKFATPYQLPAITYPLTKNEMEKHLTGTRAVSPRWFADSNVDYYQVIASLPKEALAEGKSGYARKIFKWLYNEYLNTRAFRPVHADDTQKTRVTKLWREFEEVVAAQVLRRAGCKTKDIMTVHPLFDADETMEVSAMRVQADYPIDYPTAEIKRLLGDGLTGDGGLVLDENIFQRPECGNLQDSPDEFVNSAVALSGIAGRAITWVSPVAFASKWHVGRQRPEETAVKMLAGGDVFSDRVSELGLEESVKQVKKALQNLMEPEKAATFTAYKEGSPVHPSWPAMHSAASSLSSWLYVVANLTDVQLEEVRLLDYSISYFRTLAGVHWESDNRAGLELGKRLVENQLPAFLADEYACSAESRKAIEDYVKNKILYLNSDENAQRLKWSKWRPSSWKKPELNSPCQGSVS